MSHRKEPIAIIGIGLRLPGGIDEASKLWDALLSGRSTQGKIPKSRFNRDAFFDERGHHIPGAMAIDGGYFLDENFQEFENTFFHINNMEAAAMDPEQRMLLEVVYECIEDAGVKVEQIAGTNTACYVGNFTSDFLALQNRDVDHFDRYAATGMGNTILSNRVSQIFDLKGPSLTLDTACSSSLYSLHLACTALRGGDCDAAIVAAANLMQSPEQFLATAKAGVLSPTSTCHTFDAAADGYGRGEAVNALYLKRLSTAVQNGDPIHAVLVGTAVNSNGYTAGITLPSHDGQVAVIRRAYEQAGLSVADTGYIECHGTGTAVGDPIEVKAVASALAAGCQEPVLIGSNKPNFGHSETASGLTSIIKVILALQNKKIPPTMGISRLNPNLLLDDWNVRVVQKTTAWPVWNYIPRAAVNSFGYGGANAHAILEAAEHHLPIGYNSTKGSSGVKTSFIFPLSASNEESLRARVRELRECSDWNPEDIIACSTSRSSLDVRGVIIANSANEICEQSLKISTEARKLDQKKPVFIFTGQGAQWPGMAREMFATHESFRNCFQRLDAVLQRIPHAPSWKLQDFMQSDFDEARIHEAEISQPICTAVQICLTNVLRDLGLEPSYVVGHSSGEIAAAYTAGYLSEEQAIVVAYYRGFVCMRAAKVGAMLAVGTTSEDADKKISELGLFDKINVACFNAPENVTLSGDVDAVEQLQNLYKASGKLARVLKTGGRAYHSRHMEVLASEYHRLMSDTWGTLSISTSFSSGPVWISSVRGDPINQITPDYWVQNLVSPVRFCDAVGEVCHKQSNTLWIEVGPHNALEFPTIQTILSRNPQSTYTYISVLLRGKSATETFHQAVARLYLLGYNTNFDVANAIPQVFSPRQRCRSGFPKNKWNHKKIFNTVSQISEEWCQRRHPPHDLLGTEVFKQQRHTYIWRKSLHAKYVEWLSDHCLENTVVFPAAGFIAMAVEAIRQVEGENFDAIEIHDMEISEVLVVPKEKSEPSVIVNTILSTQDGIKGSSEVSYRFQIGSKITPDSSTFHAKGFIKVVRKAGDLLPVFAPSTSYEESASRDWYKKFNELGLHYSGCFRSISRVTTPQHRDTKVAKTYIESQTQKQNRSESRYLIHPVDIDSALQSGLISISKGLIKEIKPRIPVAFKYIELRKPELQRKGGDQGDWGCFARSETVGLNQIALDASLHNHEGSVILRIGSCMTAPLQVSSPPSQISRHPILRIEWKPDLNAMLRTKFTTMPKYIDCVSAQEIPSKRLAAIDLITHKSPEKRILCIEHLDSNFMNQLRDVLCIDSAFKKYEVLHSGRIIQNELSTRIARFALDSDEELSATFEYDLICVEGLETSCLQHFLHVAPLLAQDGLVMMECSEQQAEQITSAGFECIYSQASEIKDSSLMLVRKTLLPKEMKNSVAGLRTYIVTRDDEADNSIYYKVREQLLRGNVRTAKRVRLSDVSHTLFPEHSLIISLLESSRPLLKTISFEELQSVQTMIARSSTLLWVTNGSLLDGGDPDFALVLGIARTVALEQPALKFVTFDLNLFRGSKSGTNTAATTERPSLIHGRLNSDYFGQALSSSHLAAASPGKMSADCSPALLEDLSDGESAVSTNTSVSDNISIKDDHERLAAQALVETLIAVHNNREDDREFIYKDGVLFVSRFVPEPILNTNFRQKQALETKPSQMISDEFVRVLLPNAKLPESLIFKQEEQPGKLRSDEVFTRIQRSLYGNIDFGILKGSFPAEQGKLGFVHVAQVCSVGSSVTTVAPEDFVVILSSSHVSNYLVTSEWQCFKIRNRTLDISFLEDYLTALYAVRKFAGVQPNDIVLLNIGDEGDESAAAAMAIVASNIGAYIIVNAQSLRRDFTANLSPQRFTSVDSDVNCIKALTDTSHEFIDVVFNFSATLSTQIINKIATNGKVVDINQPLQSRSPATKNVYQTCFNFRDLFKGSTGPKNHEFLQDLVTEAIELSSSSKNTIIAPPQFSLLDCSKALQKLLYDSNSDKVSIDFTKLTQLPILPLKYDSVFDDSKEYFLVGCLGGLGRSMARWMFDRGARDFIFMGQTGASRPEARAFVSFLEANGARVKVAIGDVADENSVFRAVKLAEKPIGGAVHGAMGLDEALFSNMTSQQWHKSVKPKVYGAWNIYHALKEHGTDSLDFLLFMSSLNGSVGTATEANYCAANAFLDNFSRYLRNGGLGKKHRRIPATAVGLGMISQVGYLHDHKEIEESLLRKGLQAIDEDEFLQIIDIAISTGRFQAHEAKMTDPLCTSHMLTGLEPLGLFELRKRGFQGIPSTFDDPRAALLVKMFTDASIIAAEGQDVTDGGVILSSTDSDSSKLRKIIGLLRQHLSNYLLIPPEELDLRAPLAHFGIDSVLSSAIRMWLHKTFGLLVPFTEFSSPTKSIERLADDVLEAVKEGGKD